MRKFLIGLMMFLPPILSAQESPKNLLGVSIFNNATLLPPASLTATFNQPLHPGVLLAREFGWKETEGHKLFQDISLGYIYQKYAFQSVLLFTRAGYRKYLGSISLGANLQAGYMHSFYLTDRAVFNPDGTFTAKKGGGKPQFIFGPGFDIGYYFDREERSKRIFVFYDIRLQAPFVNGYVPLLPNGSLGIGCQFPLSFSGN